jgi:hypothetical protein
MNNLTQDKFIDSISRQAAIDAFEDTTYTKNEIRRRITELPSTEPKIIYCMDCKWHNEEINQCNAQICASMCGEDFCSRAERREE